MFLEVLLLVLAFLALAGLIFLALKAVSKLDSGDDQVFLGVIASMVAFCLMLLLCIILCDATETIGGAVGGAGSRLAIDADAFHGEAYRISDRRRLQVMGADGEGGWVLLEEEVSQCSVIEDAPAGEAWACVSPGGGMLPEIEIHVPMDGDGDA